MAKCPPPEARQTPRDFRFCLALSLTLITCSLSLCLAHAAEVTQQQSVNQTTGSGELSKTNRSESTANGQLRLVNTKANLETQSTDLSSMYVQIPIADPADTLGTSGPDSTSLMTQQEDSNGGATDSTSDSTKATTWTGPWPKKFQIGYIKQSDLHQVLIESLKSDPFLGQPPAPAGKQSPTSGGGGAAPSTKTAKSSSPAVTTAAPLAGTKSVSTGSPPLAAPPSDASSLMAAGGGGNSVSYPQLKAVQQTSHMTNNNLHQPQQQQQQPQQVFWPPTSTHYGRLPMSQVSQMVSRPMAMNNKGNLYVPASNVLLQAHHNQQQQHQQQQQQQQQHNHFQQAPHRNARHQNQQQFAMNQQQHFQQHQQQPAFNQQQQQQFNQQQAMRMQYLPQTLHNNNNNNKFMQQPQFQFANFPSNAMKNQPIYTINNFPVQQQQQPQQQQQQHEEQPQVQMIQMAGVGGGAQQQVVNYATTRPANQKTTSEQFASSWRPVGTSGGDESRPAAPAGNTQQQQQQANTFDIDEVDEGFGTIMGPGSGTGIKESSGETSTMNRHPALSSHLNSTSKVSPVKIMKQQLSGGGVKSVGKTTSSTSVKGRGGGGGGEENRQLSSGDEGSNGGVKSARRAVSPMQTQSNATSSNTTDSTTQTTTQTATLDGTDSTTSSSLATSTPLTGDSSTTTTTISPVGAASSNQTTTTQSTTTDFGAELATTEPDSEVIDTTATEADNEQELTTTPATTTSMSTTTTASSLESNSRSSTSMPTSSTSGGGGESEVVATQSPGPQPSSATFPAVQSEEATGSGATESSSTTTTTTTTSSREETTTPTSSTSTSAPSGVKGGEVEGGGVSAVTPSSDNSTIGVGGTDATLTDEALMAAAVRASAEVVKSRASRQRTNSTLGGTPTRKQARSSSSERIVQASQARAQTLEPGARKGGPSGAAVASGNKLITRKAPPTQSGGKRAAKQIANKSNGTKSSSSGKLSSSKKRTSGTSGGGGNGTKPATSKAGKKITRMATSERLQAPATSQVVSMSAAQAQSTAQTLASLLLARCLSSTNCAHLLDVCSTKQAAVPLLPASQPLREENAGGASATAVNNGNWSMPVGLMSSNLMSLMQALQADKALGQFPAWRDAIETIVDQDSPSGYTLIMPSNDAIDRMPASQVDSLLTSAELMSQLIDGHILDSSETLEMVTSSSSSSSSPSSLGSSSSSKSSQQSRYLKSKRLQVNQHRDRMLTLNGKRVVYANQVAPGGGRIHVIDGLLDMGLGVAAQSSPPRLLDIMDTLKQCDKFDGFVTLAEGTGLAAILKQDEPLTVFVPSNEALRKIPDEELEVIKNNSTALREFIMYHIVNGSYFSQDLRDGQQLASILDLRPIQVGVRVDGCSRRLVEANTSPMRRPDIVAKNGVIHILDWYLTTRDNEWCDPIGRSTQSLAGASNRPATGETTSNTNSSDRLQQLASEPVELSISSSSSSSSSSLQSSTVTLAPTYATRMSTAHLPANHKVGSSAPATGVDELQTVAASAPKPTRLLAPTATATTNELNSIYVSSHPVVSTATELHN